MLNGVVRVKQKHALKFHNFLLRYLSHFRSRFQIFFSNFQVAHGLHLVGSNNKFRHESRVLFRDAFGKGLWKNTYALTDYREYFAEGVQSFFNYEGAGLEAQGWLSEISNC